MRRDVRMVRKFGMLAAVISLSACATRSPPPPSPPPPPPQADVGASQESTTQPRSMIGERCPPTTNCAPKGKSPYRQYYDLHHRRYYYYDPMKRRYFWENGQPKT